MDLIVPRYPWDGRENIRMASVRTAVRLCGMRIMTIRAREVSVIAPHDHGCVSRDISGKMAFIA